MTQRPDLQGFVREVPDGEAIPLRELQTDPPYEIHLLADCGPLFVILLEDYWVSWSDSSGTQKGRRCADFAVVDVRRNNLVFLELRRTFVKEDHFHDKVEQVKQTIDRFCYGQTPHGLAHHKAAVQIPNWQSILEKHGVEVCLVPADRLKSRADLRDSIRAPNGHAIPVITAGTVKQRSLRWSQVLRRLGWPA